MCCVQGELGSSECCAPGTEVVSAADLAPRYRRSTSSHKPHRCHLRESRATRYIMQVDHQDDEARSCAHAGTFQPIHVVYYVRLGSRLKGLWDWHGLDGRSRAPMAWSHQKGPGFTLRNTLPTTFASLLLDMGRCPEAVAAILERYPSGVPYFHTSYLL